MKLSADNALPPCATPGVSEAGCDEAGRGCLAGPVFAAAVILPDGFSHPMLNDSKQLSEKHRYELREVIEREAVAWSVASVDAAEIDEINILNASILAMHRALDGLTTVPGEIIVDGNRFKPYRGIKSTTYVKGDGRFANIAAASTEAGGGQGRAARGRGGSRRARGGGRERSRGTHGGAGEVHPPALQYHAGK